MNFPILSTLIFLPLISSFFIFLSRDKTNNYSPVYIALFSSIATFLLSLFLWYSLDLNTPEFQFVEEKSWVNNFIKFKLGVDGISILFIVLTTFITPICIISCINSVKARVKEFLIAILILETFMIGVFCSLDLVIFYLFFEAGLIPMFLIIGVWGGPRRVYSAFKFFLFTLLGSVLMLVAIIVIYWLTGTTDITQIYEIKIPKEYQNILWLAFLSSFAVKMPMWPVHTWLPDAHVEAPTAGSVILAAILLKMAGYGFLRFSIPMFPIASEYFTPLIYTLSIIAIIYTSLIALMQEDMKKLIAYSSVAHMGYVTLGIFTLTKQGIEGSIYQMISHGLISAALFLCVGVVYDRFHSRLISSYGGLVNYLPKYSFLLTFLPPNTYEPAKDTMTFTPLKLEVFPQNASNQIYELYQDRIEAPKAPSLSLKDSILPQSAVMKDYVDEKFRAKTKIDKSTSDMLASLNKTLGYSKKGMLNEDIDFDEDILIDVIEKEEDSE